MWPTLSKASDAQTEVIFAWNKLKFKNQDGHKILHESLSHSAFLEAVLWNLSMVEL